MPRLPAGTKAPDISEGIYVALKTETLQNIVLGVRNLEKQYCRLVDNNIAVSVGGEIKLFKLSISKEVQIWFDKGTPRMDGQGCDFLKHPQRQMTDRSGQPRVSIPTRPTVPPSIAQSPKHGPRHRAPAVTH